MQATAEPQLFILLLQVHLLLKQPSPLAHPQRPLVHFEISETKAPQSGGSGPLQAKIAQDGPLVETNHYKRNTLSFDPG